MKKYLFTTVFLFSFFISFAQKLIDAKFDKINSDDAYIKYDIKTLAKDSIIDQNMRTVKVTKITTINSKSFFQYTLIDSVFHYDSLLPTYFPYYEIADEWSDYKIPYIDNYATNDNSDYENYNYDQNNSSEDGYYDNNQYDEQYQNEYDAENNAQRDSALQEETNQEYDVSQEEVYIKDSVYVFLSQELFGLSQSEIASNFFGYMSTRKNAYDHIKGHKIHKIHVLDSIISETDTISKFTLQTISWENLRKLPVKLFVEKQLAKLGTKDSLYQEEVKKILSYDQVLQIVRDSNPNFEINKSGIDTLLFFNIDPCIYLADIAWLGFLEPYYSANLQEPHVREMFSKELIRRKNEKIVEFAQITRNKYDFRKDPNFKNIVQDKTITRNPRFTREIDPDKKVPIITDNSLFAYTVTDVLNTHTGRYEYQNTGVISNLYETEENVIAGTTSNTPIKTQQIKLDAEGKPILKETASFSIKYKHINIEALGTTSKNMKYDLGKIIKNRTFIDQVYLRKIGLLK